MDRGLDVGHTWNSAYTLSSRYFEPAPNRPSASNIMYNGIGLTTPRGRHVVSEALKFVMLI